MKYRGLSTDVTPENMPCPLVSAAACDVQPSLNSLHNNPVSFSCTSPSRRAPKPPPRSQITLDHSESASQSSVSYAEQATLVGACQTPSGISMSSLGSEQVFCDELESKTINSFGNARFYADFICNTDSLDTKLPFKNYEKMLRRAQDEDQHQQSECTDCSAYPLVKESDSGSSVRNKNCYSGLERKMLSSEHAYKSLQDEQEFLSWKLSESSGSKDLLTELSPAINRVMPGSSICASSVEDLGLSQNRLESPDMYDSCQSLNIIIPASCDIGSIPENIGGSFSEDFARNKRFSSLNIHSKRSEQLDNEDMIKEYESEDLPNVKGCGIASFQIPCVPQSPNVCVRPDQIHASDILGQCVMRDPINCQASMVQGCPHTYTNQHPTEFKYDRSASATDCGVRSNPIVASSVHKQLSIVEVDQNNCSSVTGLPFISRAGIEEFSMQVENKENTTAGCRQKPSHMPLHYQSNRFKGMTKLPCPVADKEFRKDPKLLPVNPLLEDGTNSQNSSKLDNSLSGNGRSPDKMHSPVIADEERIKSPSSSSLRSVSSWSSSSAKTSKSERKKQSPVSNIHICQSASTGTSPVMPVSSPSLINKSHSQTESESRIVPSRSSASEFFSDFRMTPEASQKTNKASDSEPSNSTIYAGLLRSRATRSEPPEVLRKQSAGTYVTRASAQGFKSSVSSFSPNTNPGMIPGTSRSLKERRKLFESAVVNSTSNA